MAEEEQKKIIKRAPAISTKIADLPNNQGGRVSVVGTVVSKNADISSFIIDDGETSVLVLANSPYDFDKVKEGQLVRVLGKVWGEGKEVEIQADIIQDFTSVDKELYEEVMLQ